MRRIDKSWLVASLILIFAGGAVVSSVFIRRSVEDLPSVDSLERYVPPLVTKVVDAYGQPIGEFFTERRTTVPLTKIPVDLRRAVMATEDSTFFDHWGIDLSGIARAAMANIKAGRVVQGGSTLTQQLAKTIYLTRRKTFDRKFKELLLTLQIERRYSKDEILELYLNQIYFGGGAYGVQAASQLYFDKQTQELTLSECALLAGLIRSPNRYSPLRNPDLALERRAHVLTRMREEGYITEAEEKEAAETLVIPEDLQRRSRQAHYFLEEIRKELEPEYGSETLEQGGLTIHTTLDLRMQLAAEDVVERHLAQYDLRFGTQTLAEYNEDLVTAMEKRRRALLADPTPENLELLANTTWQVELSTIPPAIQGALIALDVHTGAIRAMVGGRDFQESQFNRAIQAKRQPGSAFKPFVWAAAIDSRRFTPATVVQDHPLVYIDIESDPTLLAETTSWAETWTVVLDNLEMTPEEFAELEDFEKDELLRRFWRPQNYDGRYLGPMTIRRGLERSRNLLSVRIIDTIGPRAVTRIARAAGITSRLSPVLSLALGTSVVTLIEITNAYATFASGGFHAEPYFIERVVDRRGKILDENTPKISERINRQTAYLMTNLLQGVVNRGTGWYARRLRRSLGGKTGTTQDQRDVLFIGFSPDLAVGVWVGYDDFRPLRSGLSASSVAVPLWTDFMREALKSYPKSDFPTPDGIEYAKVDVKTGHLALPSCPNVTLEAFRRGTVPEDFCPVDHRAEEEEEEEEPPSE